MVHSAVAYRWSTEVSSRHRRCYAAQRASTAISAPAYWPTWRQPSLSVHGVGAGIGRDTVWPACGTGSTRAMRSREQGGTGRKARRSGALQLPSAGQPGCLVSPVGWI